jgi:lysozyme
MSDDRAPVPGPTPPTVAAAPPKPKAGGALALLIGLVGAGTAGALIGDIRDDEGRRLHAYKDIGQIVTICDGDTHNVRMGQVATNAECDERTAQQLLIHARVVVRCAPPLLEVGRENVLRAAARMSYNTGAFCKGWFRNRPSPGALMNARKWRAGCDEFLRYDMVRGRHIPALLNRRKRERAVCLTGAWS